MRYLVIGKRTAVCACLVCLALVTAVVGGAGRAIQAAAGINNYPIYSADTLQPLVALGINCAWDNADIPLLLDILEQRQIKATFFLVGDWCDKYPDSVRAIHEAGHEIGSHSDTHTDMTRLDSEGMRREIRDSADKIERLTGKRPELFRPPSGAYNKAVVEAIYREGFYPIQWDCDSLDYKNPSTRQMQERIMKNLRKGSILLFHAGAKNTPAALPAIIEGIQAEGYSFVSVGALIYRDGYTVDFEGRQHRAG